MNGKKILVADDDHSIVEAMQILLENEGYEVLGTTDGNTIDELYKQEPSLVFLDIWMSGINGNDVCTRLKSDPLTKSIPVIIFSANRDTEEIALQCGADGFLSKPFEMKELMSIVHSYLS